MRLTDGNHVVMFSSPALKSGGPGSEYQQTMQLSSAFTLCTKGLCQFISHFLPIQVTLTYSL
jgi:hypothetical protein